VGRLLILVSMGVKRKEAYERTEPHIAIISVIPEVAHFIPE
jgi:hypothetical protein